MKTDFHFTFENLESQLRSAKAGYAAQEAQIKVEKARIEAQKASIEGLKAALKQADRDLNRKKGLFESQDISQSVFDQAQCSFDEQQAKTKSAHCLFQPIKRYG